MAVDVAKEGFTAIVTLSGTTSKNAFDSTSVGLISSTLNALMDDPEVRSIVLTGTGRVFCAGADIDSFQNAIDDDTISLEDTETEGEVISDEVDNLDITENSSEELEDQ